MVVRKIVPTFMDALYFLGFLLLFLIFTPLFYDVRIADDAIVVEALHRYRMYRVPLAQIRTLEAERWVINYVPFPFYRIGWDGDGGMFINRRFRQVVRVDYVQPLRRSTLKKSLYVTPKDPEQFIAEVQQRIDVALQTGEA